MEPNWEDDCYQKNIDYLTWRSCEVKTAEDLGGWLSLLKDTAQKEFERKCKQSEKNHKVLSVVAVTPATFPDEERIRYLRKVVIKVKRAKDAGARSAFCDGLLDLFEGELAVINFQITIKAELEAMVCLLDASSGTSVPAPNTLQSENGHSSDANLARTIQAKAKELSLGLKSISQLYNEYAVPFELWKICLEMLYFASYLSDPGSSTVKETWARLIDQALSRGGISEACAVLKRVGSRVCPGDGAVLPLDTLCLQLEKAALERMVSGVESVGDDEIPRAFLATCNGAAEPVLNAYDQLLSNGAILPSPNLRLRLERSVLILRDLSVLARETSATANWSFCNCAKWCYKDS